MLLRAEQRGDLEGVKVCRDATPVSHLSFDDDSLILMSAHRKNAFTLKHILDTYCSDLGQLVSASKCSIFFSPNKMVDASVEVCQVLDIMTKSINGKYLGLPSIYGGGG